MSKYISIVFLLFLSILAFSQSNENTYFQNRYLVVAEPDFNIKNWAKSNNKKIKTVRPIFKKLNYWLVEFHPQKSLSTLVKKTFLQKTKGIKNAYEDHKVSNRLRPNDPMYIDQWSKSLIEVERVWDMTTGGTTVDGQEIVVAIIDDGFDLDHVDLQANQWINNGELEDNGIDDDGNGYVDDYNGLHIPSQSDNHIEDNHGTRVAGLIGAVGNNNEGIAGVNWKIKMMLFSLKRSVGSSGGSALDVIEALGYALDMRERYNQTAGAEGSFVVATNYSGGVDEQFPDFLPAWCPVYEELGRVGIINIQAVSNLDNNIEATGDMPSLCDSDFLLTVTNTDIADKKIQQAAYGNISVDISAPGEEALSTTKDNRYGVFDGTSAATPQVAGVAALLYSLPCTNFIELARENPPAAALAIKSAILNGVDLLPDLEGITVTGGRLNAHNAYLQMDKNAPVIENCPESVILLEEEATYTWDELIITDDCGNLTINSSAENGQEFRIGTTEVTISARDLLGNSTECKFEVTRKGDPDREVRFIELSTIGYDANENVVNIVYETGSFEIHIINLYNILGQKIRQVNHIPTSSAANIVQLENLNLAAGNYFVVITKAGGGLHHSMPFSVVFAE